jgi:NNP family nitrate/nitrite transporter-like MFS transporter
MEKQLTKLNIFSLKGVQMRTFHTTWLMFFVCFFGWFGLAPLMPTIRAELHLTKGAGGQHHYCIGSGHHYCPPYYW